MATASQSWLGLISLRLLYAPSSTFHHPFTTQRRENLRLWLGQVFPANAPSESCGMFVQWGKLCPHGLFLGT